MGKICLAFPQFTEPSGSGEYERAFWNMRPVAEWPTSGLKFFPRFRMSKKQGQLNFPSGPMLPGFFQQEGSLVPDNSGIGEELKSNLLNSRSIWTLGGVGFHMMGRDDSERSRTMLHWDANLQRAIRYAQPNQCDYDNMKVKDDQRITIEQDDANVWKGASQYQSWKTTNRTPGLDIHEDGVGIRMGKDPKTPSSIANSSFMRCRMSTLTDGQRWLSHLSKIHHLTYMAFCRRERRIICVKESRNEVRKPKAEKSLKNTGPSRKNLGCFQFLSKKTTAPSNRIFHLRIILFYFFRSSHFFPFVFKNVISMPKNNDLSH